MGILYDVSMEAKRKHFIEELTAKGITSNKEGKSIHDMDYHELKSELVLSAFRDMDVDHPDNKWF